jgi:hypothetical protein
MNNTDEFDHIFYAWAVDIKDWREAWWFLFSGTNGDFFYPLDPDLNWRMAMNIAILCFGCWPTS